MQDCQKIEKEDLNEIYKNFKSKKKLNNKNILITGFNGFLGKYIVRFLIDYKDKLKWKNLVLVDNFKLNAIEDKTIKNTKNVKLFKSDITSLNLDKKEFAKIDFIMHMASIASPHFYRKFPLETISANVDGLKKLLEKYKNKKTKILYFSSSEIYGDPPNEQIPTKETYWGNVSSVGPRSCYDESKRFCETLCYYYSKKFKICVKVVRPFNNFGPGMKLDDKRLPADLAKSIIGNKQIKLYSNGKPKRSFCYITDAVTGYFQALTYEKFEIFNIGNDKNEISVRNLTKLYIEIGEKLFGYNKEAIFVKSKDPEYLTNNPNRRCPNIDKARKLLYYKPKVSLSQGIKRFLIYNS